MTTIYRHIVNEHVEQELGRLKRKLTRPGHLVVDTGVVTSFARHRLGVTLPEFQRTTYTRIVQDILAAERSGTITFPYEAQIEFGQFLDGRKKDLGNVEASDADSNKKGMYADLTNHLGLFGEHMAQRPSEALIVPDMEQYRGRINDALRSVAQRPGVIRETRPRYGNAPAHENHAYNDVGMLTTWILIGLSDPNHNAYLHTRDSGILRMGLEIERDDERGLMGLAREYDFPCSPQLIKRLKIDYDRPLADMHLHKNRQLMDAHLHLRDMDRARVAAIRKRTSKPKEVI